ncbi:hypothetical protein Ms3S1_05200 [Methylosinus sp. 3S-1]
MQVEPIGLALGVALGEIEIGRGVVGSDAAVVLRGQKGHELRSCGAGRDQRAIFSRELRSVNRPPATILVRAALSRGAVARGRTTMRTFLC